MRKKVEISADEKTEKLLRVLVTKLCMALICAALVLAASMISGSTIVVFGLRAEYWLLVIAAIPGLYCFLAHRK